MGREGSSPRVLSIDIETYPILAHVWSLWDANAVAVERNTVICCFSAKWLGGKQTTKALPDYKGYKSDAWDDSALLADIWKLLDEADIVIAQNGDRFDVKKINARLIRHGLKPPTPYKTVDTLKTARRIFGFDSNKLNDLCRFLGIGQKVHTGGFTLWQGCMAGDAKAWARMKRYNAQDVRILEKLYLRFLPWTTNHPNVGMWKSGPACPKCGSRRMQARGVTRNGTTEYRRLQCQSCGGWSRTNKNERKAAPLVNLR